MRPVNYPTDRPAAFLGMPHRGRVHPESVTAALVGAWKGEDHSAFTLTVHPHDNSLLAHCFNQCWCKMLSEEHRGWRYFAMLHSDIAPMLGWLEVLVEEMHAGGFDVMHAIVPIKDERGLTSTAIGHGTHARRWELKRRLTQMEVKVALPPTFGIEEVLDYADLKGFDPPHDDLCLLPNTGCMVVDLGSPAWQEFPGFKVEDQLVVVTPEGLVEVKEGRPRPPGTVLPNTVSEDWNLGMWCWRQGLRVGATSKVTVRHGGDHWYDSCQVWGHGGDQTFEAVGSDCKTVR